MVIISELIVGYTYFYILRILLIFDEPGGFDEVETLSKLQKRVFKGI